MIKYKGVAVVWGQPEKELPLLGDVTGRFEFGGELDLGVLHGDDGNRYCLLVIDNHWVPAKGAWHPEAGRVGQWWWDIEGAQEMAKRLLTPVT